MASITNAPCFMKMTFARSGCFFFFLAAKDLSLSLAATSHEAGEGPTFRLARCGDQNLIGLEFLTNQRLSEQFV